jgi:hypothetical protein
METAKQRLGRPTVAAAPNERASLGLRVTAEAKSRIEEAAIRSGRSISQEVELRVERSFTDDVAFTSESMRLWSYLAAREFAQSGRLAARGLALDDPDATWMQDPECLLQASMSLMKMLARDYLAAGGTAETMRLHLEHLALNVEPKPAFSKPQKRSDDDRE